MQNNSQVVNEHDLSHVLAHKTSLDNIYNKHLKVVWEDCDKCIVFGNQKNNILFAFGQYFSL